MKYLLIILIYISLLPTEPAGNRNVPKPGRVDSKESNIDGDNTLMTSSIKIKVGDKIFAATLLDNATATTFRAMLPLTIPMTELNGNEKYFRLANSLPVNASNPGTINAGDLMLWDTHTVVLFYKSFSTSYTYTKIGKIDNPTGLAAALDDGNVTVTFER